MTDEAPKKRIEQQREKPDAAIKKEVARESVPLTEKRGTPGMALDGGDLRKPKPTVANPSSGSE